MTERYQIFKCSKCGNVVEVVEAHEGELSCCGSPMMLMKQNTSDGAKEKHVPVVERTLEGYMVKIGSAPHPMEADHYIEMIELIVDGHHYKKYLNPGDAPAYEFFVKEGKLVEAREYCNKHGLWYEQDGEKPAKKA